MKYPNGRWSLKDFGVSGLAQGAPLKMVGESPSSSGERQINSLTVCSNHKARHATHPVAPLTPIQIVSVVMDLPSMDRFKFRDTDLEPDDHEAREQIEMEAAEAKADQERDGV